MKRLYPGTSQRITSIAAMIAASFIFFVTWIYIYFDFSSSSLIQALQLTADGTSGWLVNVIKAISAVYNSVPGRLQGLQRLAEHAPAHPLGATVIIAFCPGLFRAACSSLMMRLR